MAKHYLYRHIRKDKNQPFYIGIGTKTDEIFCSHKHEYRRAYCKDKLKSIIWKRIVAKTPYEVEILMESDDYEFIKEKEKEFIKLYGRIDLKTGILANLTDGGQGTLGKVWTKESRNKISNSHKEMLKNPENLKRIKNMNKGRVKSIETRKKLSIRMKNRIISEETREKMRIASKKRGFSTIAKENSIKSRRKLVLNLNTGIYYDSIVEAAYYNGLKEANLLGRLRRKIKNNYGIVYA